MKPMGTRRDELGGILKLRRQLEFEPAVPIRRAADLLKVHPRTLYRRRHEFELIRRGRSWYITLRSLKRHIEEEEYHSTAFFDLTAE